MSVHSVRTFGVLLICFLLTSLSLAAPNECVITLTDESAPFRPGKPGDRFVIVTDPYSAGAFLAPLAATRGFRTVYIRSRPKDPTLFAASGINRADFELGVDVHGDWSDLLRKVDTVIGKGQVAAVIAGSDPGSPLMDFLADYYKSPGNPLVSSRSRRNKYWMAVAANKAGLAMPEQILVHHPREAIEWIEGNYGKWPVIIKPTESAGTDDIFLCEEPSCVFTAVKSIIGKENVIGRPNTEALVQEILEGEKYIVEVVSAKGQHRVAFIWKYDYIRIRDKAFVFKKVELLESKGSVQDRLIAESFRFLDAIGHTTGVAHVEAADEGGAIKVFDYGSRPGGGLPPICDKATDRRVIEMTLDAHLEPDKLLALPERYTRTQEAVIIGVNNFLGLAKIDHEAAAWYADKSNTPSFFAFRPRFSHGSLVPRTEDLHTTPARLEFVGETAMRDYETFVRREADPRTAIIKVIDVGGP